MRHDPPLDRSVPIAANPALLVIPASNTTVVPEFAALLPDWGTPLVARVPNPPGGITAATLPAYAEGTIAAAGPFRAMRPGLVVYGCTAAGFLAGVAGNRAFVQRLADETAAPVVSTSDAMVAALRHVGARRIAVLTPYLKPANDGLQAYIEESGIEVARLDSFLCPTVEALCAVTADQVRERALAMDVSGCDALFIACTQLPTVGALDAIRAGLGLPVWSANAATAWLAARVSAGAAAA